MSVIDTADKRMFEEADNGNDSGARYWAAYKDGAIAQKREDRLGTCIACKYWQAFADAMECTRCHEERASNEYCSKWVSKHEDENIDKDQ